MKKVAIWAFAIALFMMQILLRTVSADPGSSWEEMYTQSGECRIEFPSKPERIQQSIQVSEQGHRLNYDIYLAPFKDRGVFLLLIATYPIPLGGGHERAGLEGLLKGIVGHRAENKLIFAKKIDFLGAPAIDFLVQSDTSYFRGQALMVGNKLYLIAMEGKSQTMEENVFQQFLRSFSFAKTQSRG